MRKYIANLITVCRILCSIAMVFFTVFSASFYIAYLLGGLSDMVDGAVARKTNSISRLGARLDTVADFVFISVSLGKLLPHISIPKWLWIWIAAIEIIKIANMGLGLIHQKKLISIHTVMNKITGLAVFLFPLTLNFIDLKYSAVLICFIATISAIQEGYYVKSGREIVM